MASDAAITWIHLSDFHAGQRGESAWHAIDVAFEANVLKLAGRLGTPDLVLFTGDLANRGGRDEGQNDEYAKVDRLLERLNEWLGAEVPVFAVPGNHDLVRPKKPWDYAAFLHYEQDTSVHEALWKGDDELRGRLERLFPHYPEWMQRRVVGSLRKAGWEPHVSTRMPGDLSVIVEKHGVRLGLVGLNSAWTHLSDEAETRGLQLPAEQLHAALPPTAGNPLDWFRGGQPSFLLMHHPPGWLSKRAKSTFNSHVCPPGRFALTLFGHTHEGRSEVRDPSGTGRLADYQSPSLFGLEHYGTAKERQAFGYTWGRLTARGEVRVWPQKVVQRKGGRLVFDRDQGFGWDEEEHEGVVLVEGAPPSAAPDAAKAAEPASPPAVPLGWQEGMVDQRIAVSGLLARRMPEVVRREWKLVHRFQSQIINGLCEDASRVALRGSEPRRELETNVVHGVELMLVRGGRFLMGSPKGEVGRNDNERPHEVELGSFWLARTPVTNAQYREYMNANPGVQEPGYWGDRNYNHDEQPVVGVSWRQAQAYCAWAGLRLPTEAEWEYACRAGTTTRYSTGDEEEDLKRVGWYLGNSGGRLHAVRELEPNGWGLYDMHGNVFEWCEEAWGGYGTSARAGEGPVGGTARVLRGGIFGGEARSARSAYRFYWPPDVRVRDVGFRPAHGHP